MGIDYYYLRATYPWPEQAFDPTYPVRWVSQFYTISDVSQVLLIALGRLEMFEMGEASVEFSCFPFSKCQTLATFLLVPILTNRMKLHDALVSRFFISTISLLIKITFQSWTLFSPTGLLPAPPRPNKGLVVREALTKKNVFFRALPEKGGGRPLPIFLTFFYHVLVPKIGNF